MALKQETKKNSPAGQFVIRWSLAYTVVLGLILLISIPVTVMGLATYFRSRTLLQDQSSTQLKSIVTISSSEANKIDSTFQNYLNELLADPVTSISLQDLVRESTSETNRFLAQIQLSAYLHKTPLFGTSGADQISLVLPDGTVTGSTNPDWVGKKFNPDTELPNLLGAEKTTTVYNLGNWYPDIFVLLSTKPLKASNSNKPIATVLVSVPAIRLEQLLTSSEAIFPQSAAQYITQNGESIGFDPSLGILTRLRSHEDHRDILNNVFNNKTGEGLTQFNTSDRGQVFTYAKWIPSLNTGLVLEVPESVIFQQVNSLVPFTALLITIAVLVAAILAFIGSQYLTRPLVRLSSSAKRFASGDWSERVPEDRPDEIGLLAHSFNNMVEQISDLYHSMENKVEERSRHIRSASEIGQIATASTSRKEIAQKTATMVIERFGFQFAAIALIDFTGTNAVVVSAEGSNPLAKEKIGRQLPVGGVSLIGWVAQHNQVRIIKDTSEESDFTLTLLQTGSRSEIALPISIGSQVLGVLEVQSDQAQGFDQETTSVLQTLSNQVANGLQNIRLLEATQINLEETTLLYQASRKITTTQSESEILRIFAEAMSKTPYLVGIFAVQPNFLSVLSFLDPDNPQISATSQGITLPLRNLATILSQTHLVILDDLTSKSEYDHLLSFFVRRGCHTVAIFPILVSGNLSRIIVLGSRQSFTLTETGLQPFSYLFEVIATTLERFKIDETLQYRVNELQTISSFSQAISAETDVFQLYSILHQQVIQIIGSDISFLVVNYSAKDQLIHIPYIFEDGELLNVKPFPLGDGLTSYLINSRQPLLLVKNTEAQALELGVKIIGSPAKSWLGVPLILAGEVIGAIILQDMSKEERFTDTDLSLFTTLAPQIATAIRNAQLLTEMKQALNDYDQERFLLNTLLENIPDHVYFKDMNGRYLRISQSYARQLGLTSPSEAVSRSDVELSEGSNKGESREEFDNIITAGLPVQKLKNSTQANQETWQVISQIPMLDQEKIPVGLLGIAHDVTDLKKSEQVANHRAQYLSIAQEIARDTSLNLDTSTLLRNAVQMVRGRFNFYHASIFLLDPLGKTAELKESTGEVGEQMKAQKHRLAVGSQSLVGNATSTGQAVVINNVNAEPTYFANPLLPDTQSELVIPLKLSEKVLGALDVQSVLLNAFSEEEVNILQILADQLAIAISNATMFSETQNSLDQHRMIHQVTVSASTAQDVDSALINATTTLHQKRPQDRIAIYLSRPSGRLEIHSSAGFDDHNMSNPSIAVGQGIIGKAAQESQSIIVKDFYATTTDETISALTRSAIAAPIIFSNQLVGVLYAENPEPEAYDESDQEIFISLANTIGAIITNARLVTAVRQQVERQRRLFEVTNRIRQTVDIRTIMEVSATEIAKVVDARRTRINLSIAQKDEPLASQTYSGQPDEEN